MTEHIAKQYRPNADAVRNAADAVESIKGVDSLRRRKECIRKICDGMTWDRKQPFEDALNAELDRRKIRGVDA